MRWSEACKQEDLRCVPSPAPAACCAVPAAARPLATAAQLPPRAWHLRPSLQRILAGSGRECWTPLAPCCALSLALAPPPSFVPPCGTLHRQDILATDRSHMHTPATLPRVASMVLWAPSFTWHSQHSRMRQPVTRRIKLDCQGKYVILGDETQETA